MKSFRPTILLLALCGCQAAAHRMTVAPAPKAATTRPSAPFSFELSGWADYQNDHWIQHFCILNFSDADVILAKRVFITAEVEGSDGVGLLHWRAPVFPGPGDYICLDRTFRLAHGTFTGGMGRDFQTSLDFGAILGKATHAHVRFEITGCRLAADEGKMVDREFTLQMQEDIPPRPTTMPR